MRLPAWLSTRRAETGFDVDYDKPVTLPNGATKVLWHHPPSTGKVSILPSYLQFRPMPAGATYEEYRTAHPTATFGDAPTLDALIKGILDDKGCFDRQAVARILGNFRGQIFFLGTAFEAVYAGSQISCFAYLNWRTHYPATRYICPADNPINHDVNCCACHIEWPVAPGRPH